jgi:hypothetical protein
MVATLSSAERVRKRAASLLALAVIGLGRTATRGRVNESGTPRLAVGRMVQQRKLVARKPFAAARICVDTRPVSLRYYLYVSESKVDQLFEQIPSKRLGKIAKKLTIRPQARQGGVRRWRERRGPVALREGADC